MDNFERIKLMDREELANLLAYFRKDVIDAIEQEEYSTRRFNLNEQIDINLNWLNQES